MLNHHNLLCAVAASAIETNPPTPVDNYECSVAVPSGKVASDLTGFPVRVNLADLSAGFWSAVASDGANIRVKNDSDVDVPCDVVWIDKSAMKGEVFFKAPSLLAASDNNFKISVTTGDPAVAKSDPIGRHAVWSDYDAVFMFSELEDRSGNGRDATTVGTVPNNAYVPATYSGDMGSAHQGVAWDGTYYYVIDTTQVRKHNWSGTQIGSAFNLVDTGTADVNHFGDGTFHDGNLYVVYETYPNSPYDNQHVVVIDPNTMTMITKYDISAQGHEVSSITYDPVNGYFVITDYTVSGASVLHKYDDSFNYLGTIPCSPISNKQGIAYYGNAFWITCAAKELYKMPLDGSSKTLMWSGGLGNYVEGIAAKDNGDLLILIDYTSQSYIYRFAPGSAVGEPGWLNLDGSGHAVGHDMPTRTQWTMGASVVLLRNNNGRSLLSYSPEVTSNNFRATLAVRSSPINWGIWNSTDSWQTTSAVAATIGARRRLHHTQNGTTNRKLWIDGVLRTTDTGTAQRPATSGETMGLFIGAEDTSATERVFGSINYVYLRNGELSADWLAAEYASWEQAGFYTVSEIP